MFFKSPLRAAVIAGVATLSALTGCVQSTPSAPANAQPLAIFAPSTSNASIGSTVTFDAGAAYDPDGTIVSYAWDFGDFQTGSGSYVSHTFNSVGSFVVTLTVTDERGATGSSSTTISIAGVPTPPTGLTKTGAGCCDTYADFSWNAVPGATKYEILMDPTLGCIAGTYNGIFDAPATTGRIKKVGLCLGTKYNAKIRSQANGQWGAWSPNISFTL